ncbi:MAG: hypothetical protein WDZ41_01255 [Candidatus Babeliales bacterium]
MKKLKVIFSIFLFLYLYFSPNLLSFEEIASIGQESLKSPEEFKEPATAKEAKEKWQEVQKEEQKAEEVKKKARDKWAKARDKMNEAQFNSKEWHEANKEYEAMQKQLFEVETIQEEWQKYREQLAQTEAFKQAKAQGLTEVYELPQKEEIPQLGWWEKLQNKVRAWFKERQVDFYNWLGDKNRVIKIRQDLTDIYSELGNEKLLAKARNSKKLGQLFDREFIKIRNGLESLKAYQEAHEKIAATPQEKEVIKQEINDLIVELLTVSKNLADEKYQGELVEEIDKALDDLGVSPEFREEIEKKIGVSVISKELKEKRQKEVRERSRDIARIRKITQNLNEQVLSDSPLIKEIDKNPIDFDQSKIFQEFTRNIAQLEEMLTKYAAQIPESEKPIHVQSLRDAYHLLNETLVSKVFDLSIPAEDRAIIMARAYEIYPKYIEAERRLQDVFIELQDQYAREATTKELTNEKGELMKPLSPRSAERFTNLIENNRFLEKILSRVPDNEPQEILTEYNKFDAAMQAWQETLETRAVNQESLRVREKMLEFYNEILQRVDDFSREKDIASDQLAKVLLDIHIKLQNINHGLEKNRQELIIAEQTDEGIKTELVKEHALISEEKLQQRLKQIKKRELFAKDWERLSGPAKHNIFLNEIITHPLTKVKAKNIDEFFNQIKQIKQESEKIIEDPYLEATKFALKPTQTKEAKAPKDWWESYLKEGREKGGTVSQLLPPD